MPWLQLNRISKRGPRQKPFWSGERLTATRRWALPLANGLPLTPWRDNTKGHKITVVKFVRRRKITMISQPQIQWFQPLFGRVMMTSSNGTIFRVTGPLWGNSPVPVNSPHQGQWRGALMSSLICAWINDWVNNHEAGDLRRHRGHYDVNVMYWMQLLSAFQ